VGERVVRGLWVTRKSIDAGHHPPELLVAWDEWTIDENQEGWAAECQAALEAVGDDLAAYRYIDFRFDGEDVAAPFETATVGVKVHGHSG